MKIRIPVFQMVLKENNNTIGLVFSTEMEEFVSQSILFVIPKFINGKLLSENFEDVLVYFPVDANSEYVELESTIRNKLLNFNTSVENIEISFEVQFDNKSFEQLKLEKVLKYIGKENYLLNKEFYVISPKSIRKMDKLYLKHKITFVGMTPKFGNLNNNSFVSNIY